MGMYCKNSSVAMHRNENVVAATKLPSPAALEVIILTTSSAENLRNIMSCANSISILSLGSRLLDICNNVDEMYTAYQTFHLTRTPCSRDTAYIMYMHNEVSIQGRFQIPPQMLVAPIRTPNVIAIFCMWTESDMCQHRYGQATCISYECFIQ